MDIEFSDADPVYTIGVIAKKFNISVHSLRLYESEGLIIPFKTETNRRLYSNNDIKRVQCIRDMIENQKLNFAGIKWALSMIPCWSLLPCTEKDREVCDAYTETTMPCWSVPHKAEKCQKLDCRECHVYLSFSNCKNFKEYLKDNWK
jgi:MerR family transcriptional regulator, heat shock protein HspR